MKNRFKFRLWDKEKKYMITEDKYDETCKIYGEDELYYCVEYRWTDPFYCDEDFILMQCTGLKDKNGKLIYEGDIVKFAEYDWTDFSFKDWEQQKAVVIWGGDYDYPAFDLKGTDFDGTNGLSYIFGEGWTIEVIGNIYENKELLNEIHS